MNIITTARYLPPDCVTNQDLSALVDTNDEWIVSRTGISNRHFAKNQSNTDLAIAVGKQLLERSGVPPEEVGCVMVATFTPDNLTPSIACQVHKALGLHQTAMAFDFNAACSGFVYGLQIAQQMLIGSEKKIILIGSEKISSHLDFTDRNTCILFGDGAAGAILENGGESAHFVFGTKGEPEVIRCPVGGKVAMEGKEVFVFAVNAIAKSLADILKQTGLREDEIDHVVCHQANLRIISHVYKKLGILKDKFYINVDRYGNTSSASIPIVLDEMREQSLLKKGDKIMCVGFGAGLTWGATLITW